jgi:hypothetical protein
MRTFIFAVVVSVLPACAAVAEQPSQPQPRKPPTQSTLRPAKGNPCAEFGPGFVKVEGSCVKIGGSVNVEAGSSLPR